MTILASLGPITAPSVDYSSVMPALLLLGGALLLLAFTSLFRVRLPQSSYSGYTVAMGGFALVASNVLWVGQRTDVGTGPFQAFDGAVIVDGFSVFFMFVIGAALILGALICDAYLRREDIESAEPYVLMLICAAGGMFMSEGNDLILIFLGLEILSISLYILTGLHRRRPESREAAMKYFVLGAFSSALFLYGVALTYGATGTTKLTGIVTFLANNVPVNDGVLLVGMGLLIIGLCFKVAAVPFHTWTPDVYQGAPSPITGFMAGAAKAAGFAALMRILLLAFRAMDLDWKPVIWVVVVLTLVVGSIGAVVQTDVKRMLAYSSIAHAGYVLIGLEIGSVRGIAAALFYLLAYTFMVLGSFAIVTLAGRSGDSRHNLEDYRGFAGRHPILALTFTVLLLAQAGVPLTTGFVAKFYVIAAAVEQHSYALAIIAMAMASVAAFFYLRLVLVMYAKPDHEAIEESLAPVPAFSLMALCLTLGFTVVFGIMPSPVLDFARHALLLS